MPNRDPEKKREYDKKWRLKNPDKVKANKEREKLKRNKKIVKKTCKVCSKTFTPLQDPERPRVRVSHSYCSKICSEVAAKKYRKEYQTEYTLSGKGRLAGKKYRESEKGQKTIRNRLKDENYKEQTRVNYRKYYAKNEKFREKKAKYKKEFQTSEHGKKWRKEYRDNKRANDPIYKLQDVMRTRLGHFVKAKNITKRNRTFEMVGCTPEFLKKHLEEQFYNHPKTNEAMSWKNHKNDGWHIDHIVPLAKATNEDEMKKLFHYTNLQPLWAEENIKKRDKYEI